MKTQCNKNSGLKPKEEIVMTLAFTVLEFMTMLASINDIADRTIIYCSFSMVAFSLAHGKT